MEGAGRFEKLNRSLLLVPGLNLSQGNHGLKEPKVVQIPTMLTTPNHVSALNIMVVFLVITLPRTTLNQISVVTQVVDVVMGVSPNCVSQFPISSGVPALSPLKK